MSRTLREPCLYLLARRFWGIVVCIAAVIVLLSGCGPGGGPAGPTTEPPAAPTNLTAIGGDGEILLSWPSVTGATSYQVSYGTVHSGPYSMGLLNTTSLSTIVSGLENDHIYYFIVKAANSAGASAASPEAHAMPADSAMQAPTDLAATAGHGQVSLSWTAVAGATSYVVAYGTASGTYNTGIITTNNAPATITGLTGGITYYFVVKAITASSMSENSLEASATPLAPILAAPTGVTATPGDGQVALSWNTVTDATGYIISYSTTDGGPYDLGPVTTHATSVTVTGLDDSTTYYFVVTAHNAHGEGSPSAQVSATTTSSSGSVPEAPFLQKAVGGVGKVALKWISGGSGETYKVYLAANAEGPYTYYASTADTGMEVTGLPAFSHHYFVVTASNGAGESGYSNPMAGYSYHGTELLQNGGMESGTGVPDAWMNGGSNTTFTWATGNAHTGTRSLQMVITGLIDSNEAGWGQTFTFPAPPAGHHLRFSIWVKRSAVIGSGLAFAIRGDDTTDPPNTGNPEWLVSTEGVGLFDGTSDWVEIVLETPEPVPAGIQRLTVFLLALEGTSGGTVYFDDASLIY